MTGKNITNEEAINLNPRGEFIRRQDFKELFGISYSTVAHLSRSDENFPLPIKVSNSITLWSVDELRDYILSKPRGERLK